MRRGCRILGQVKRLVILLAAILPLLGQGGTGAFVHSLTNLQVERKGDDLTGILTLIDNGKTVEVAKRAIRGWIVTDGTRAVYSSTGGAGGYEGEGQSLWLYAPGLAPRKLTAQKFAISDVKEVAVGHNRALVLVMEDGGLGATHIAVIDPKRGLLLTASKARLLRIDGVSVLVGYQREGDWEKLANGTDIPPFRTQSYDLRQIYDRISTTKSTGKK